MFRWLSTCSPSPYIANSWFAAKKFLNTPQHTNYQGPEETPSRLAGEISGALSGWRAGYVPHKLVGLKRVHIGLTFTARLSDIFLLVPKRCARTISCCVRHVWAASSAKSPQNCARQFPELILCPVLCFHCLQVPQNLSKLNVCFSVSEIQLVIYFSRPVSIQQWTAAF